MATKDRAETDQRVTRDNYSMPYIEVIDSTADSGLLLLTTTYGKKR
jgi:hypothetical protein